MRADVYLVENGYVKSRQKAKTLIDDGRVKIDGTILKKPSIEVDDSVEHNVTVIDDCPYVSRGGLKLEKILEHLNLDLNGAVALDIGASTGGFTHCMLIKGASRVYAVDSGTDQLDVSLRNNERVISIENFNARNLTKEIINQEVDVITVDVSFISQTLIIPSAIDLLKENGVYIGLIKPQFEVGKAKVGKGGIVKNKKYRKEAVEKVLDYAALYNLSCIALIESPITGGDGNVEYVAAFKKSQNNLDNKQFVKLIFR